MSVRVLIIGAGGLGAPAALGLAAEPELQLTVVDDDRVELSNLARQVLFGDADQGRPKASVLVEALAARFARGRDTAVEGRFDGDSGPALVAAHDLVVDGSDNFATRFLANDLCVRARRPLVHGAALQWRGQLLAVRPGSGPCLRCLFEGEPPAGAAPTCAQAGVASPLVGLVGGWMAEAALALIRGEDTGLTGIFRTIDAWTGRERRIPVGRDPSCCACGTLAP